VFINYIICVRKWQQLSNSASFLGSSLC